MPNAALLHGAVAALVAALLTRDAEAALCDALPATNCWGNDLKDGGVSDSASACCALCAALDGCRAWTWDANEGNPTRHCWLKSSCAGARVDPLVISGSAVPPPPPPPPQPPAPPPSDYHNGVSMGGWLLTEPSWMFDQFSAPAEADLVAQLRKQGGDAFAVTTMRNHWTSYYPDAAIDALAAFGATHARIPVGYWIVEAPVIPVPAPGDGTMYSYGFNHEGFVTGGINELESMIAKFKARGLKALVDLHAMPGGSSQCQSYAGWQVEQPLFWTGTPPASNATPISACGGAGSYRTTRGNARTWMAVGEESVLALGAWVVGLQANTSLSDTVVGVEVVNEPGLGFDGVQSDIERLLTEVVPKLQALLAAGRVSTNVTVNFIGPNDVNAGAWIAAQVKSGLFDASRLLVDFHQYYNWDGTEDWQALSTKICGTINTTSPWAQYTDAGLPVVIGEWSCSTNLGAKAYTDLTDPAVVAHLRTLYANQMSLFSSRGGNSPGAVGQHHWTLRMGSGWEPRPSAENPSGGQVPGSAWNQSLPGFDDAVWSLGDLMRVGVAQPLKELNVTGICHCAGCSASG